MVIVMRTGKDSKMLTKGQKLSEHLKGNPDVERLFFSIVKVPEKGSWHFPVRATNFSSDVFMY